MAGAVHDLVSAPELWRGAATALVAADATVLVQTRAATIRPAQHRRTPWAAPALSVLAASAAYTCVPDTERALWVLGATAGAAVIAVAFRRPWTIAAVLVAAGLVWVAVEDGPPRDSAVIGTLAVAVLHLVLQHRVASTVRRLHPLLLAVAAASMAFAARVAGRGDGLLRPVFLSVVVLAAVGLLVRRTGNRTVRP